MWTSRITCRTDSTNWLTTFHLFSKFHGHILHMCKYCGDNRVVLNDDMVTITRITYHRFHNNTIIWGKQGCARGCSDIHPCMACHNSSTRMSPWSCFTIHWHILFQRPRPKSFTGPCGDEECFSCAGVSEIGYRFEVVFKNFQVYFFFHLPCNRFAFIFFQLL